MTQTVWTSGEPIIYSAVEQKARYKFSMFPSINDFQCSKASVV